MGSVGLCEGPWALFLQCYRLFAELGLPVLLGSGPAIPRIGRHLGELPSINKEMPTGGKHMWPLLETCKFLWTLRARQ